MQKETRDRGEESILEEDNWAINEFGQADLGDKRRTERLIQLAKVLGENPQGSLPEATGNVATLKAAYRFFDNQDIEGSAILESHLQSTYQRMRGVELVLAVQDTSYLDWTHHPTTEGLGPLVTSKRRGLITHSTMAFTAERVPLGILAQQVWAREEETYGQLKDHHDRPIEEKESYKWLKSVACLENARTACPDTQFVSVGDREADIYDLLNADRPMGVDLLVRAAMNRRVEHEERYLWAAVEQAPLAAMLTVHIPARHGQAARTAELEVRWRVVTLHPPVRRKRENLPKVKVWAVLAAEKSPQPEVTPVEWLLLTTVPVRTAQDAFEKIDWYTCRWGIEVWFKVLKSGCKIEDRRLASAERLKRCMALYSVIAWRILYATMLARAVPDLPGTVLLEPEEWQALFCAIHNTAVVPQEPPSLGQAVRWIARLGGFLGRKSDGDPGPTVLWKGFQHLADLTKMYRTLRPAPPS
jgi:hypothetical protein